MKSYCFKCRTKREIKDPQQTTLENRKPAIKGTCSVCGTRVYHVEVETIEQIKDFFEPKDDSYRKVLKMIRRSLDDYRDSTEGRKAIYRIATRRDYQGEELKTAASIQRKLIEKRAEKPTYDLFDIEDIVGCRVVCVYPTDVDVVRKYIWDHWREWGLRKPKGESKNTKQGYRAYHFTVSPRGLLGHYNCEIQLVTMLQEAWSFKTHDLLYKPKEAVREEHENTAKLLSDSLRVVDKQSQILEREIQKKRREEAERKDAARKQIMRAICESIEPSQDPQLSGLKDSIERRKNLALGKIEDLVDRVDSLAQKRGWADLNLCRIASSLATERLGDELNAWALGLIDQHIANVGDENKGHGHLFKGLTLWALGEEGAVEESEKALEYGNTLKDKALIYDAKANIAYFIADLESEELKDLALKYSEEAQKDAPGPDNLDTYGYVRIVFGEDFKQVQKGWDACKKAYKRDTDKELALAFLLIAQDKAIKRFIEFSEKGLLAQCTTKHSPPNLGHLLSDEHASTHEVA